jgi:hypothetical protein
VLYREFDKKKLIIKSVAINNVFLVAAIIFFFTMS